MITPRYSCIFIRRLCPRKCSYCWSKDVRGDGHLLSLMQWAEALRILESHGVVFHLILGNELFSYPWRVELVKELNRLLKDHLSEIGAGLPAVNWDFSTVYRPALDFSEVKERLMKESYFCK